MENKQYIVLHEIGDYYQPQPLSEKDNKIINEQMNKKDSLEEKKKRILNEDAN